MQTKRLRNRLITTLLAGVLASNAASVLSKTDMATPNTIPLKTQCIGRFLVDLPLDGQMARSQSFEWTENAERIADIPNEEQFWKEVSNRKEQLANSPHNTEGTLLSEIKTSNRWAIVLYREKNFIESAYDMDRYYWTGHAGFKMHTVISNDERNNLSRFTTIFNNIQARPDNETPTTPGFCIDGAMLVGELPGLLGSVERRVTGSIDIADANDWKGVSLGVATAENRTAADVEDDEGSIADQERKRYSKYKDRDPKAVKSFDVLRDTSRTLGGFRGREAVTKMVFASGKVHYVFNWTYSGEKLSTAKPFISIYSKFNDAYADDQQFNQPPPEDQLLAMWDAVLNSLRWRKGA